MTNILPTRQKHKKYDHLRQLAYDSILQLSTTEGINASSLNEVFGCIFGRDSAISILKILRVHTKKEDEVLLDICKRTLQTLIILQGKEFNLESGEEPGKFVHEYRPDKYERLLKKKKPWYVYPDGKLRNYDSIDSTSLVLIAIYRFWQTAKDSHFLLTALPAVEAGLNWIITFGDKDKDLLIDYELPAQRTHGGLPVQSWTDSADWLTRSDGTFPVYPIAAIEVQAVTWLALRLWADFYVDHHRSFGKKLLSQANLMKKVFNKRFIFTDRGISYGAQALDGTRNPIHRVTGNPLLCLWATYQKDGKQESILDEKYIPQFVKRGFQEDLFEEDAGIRTMSTSSDIYNPTQTSYHNGSFWPMLNGLIHEGLTNWDFTAEANLLKEATLAPIDYFKTPIELYIKDSGGSYIEYESSYGKKGCRYQAWTAASVFDLLTV